MKLYCLGQNPSAACYVVTFKNTSIMFDCGMELEHLLRLLPYNNTTSPSAHLPTNIINNTKSSSALSNAKPVDPLGILKSVGSTIYIDQAPRFHVPDFDSFDISGVDIILISNHMNMLALPFVTEYTNFSGKIYTTEPTKNIGRRFMEELVKYSNIAAGSKEYPEFTDASKRDAYISGLPPAQQRMLTEFYKWKKIYTLDDVKSCISKVQAVSYLEQIDVYSSFSIIPVSSGFALGSCNWIIQTEYEKVVYIAASSPAASRHPEPLDYEKLRDAHVAIVTDLNTNIRQTADFMFNELCRYIGITLSAGGDVLIPCYSTGVIYDLIELIRSYLVSLNMHNANMYFVSPVAEHSLAFSSISAEWLCKPKQDRTFQGDPPFAHADMIKNNHLKVFKGLDTAFATAHSAQRSSPCIVFMGHPSFRLGDSAHLLMRLWNKNPNNSVLCIEPEYDLQALLQPFQPIQCQVYHCPIDLRLRPAEAVQLIREIRPRHIIIPRALQRWRRDQFAVEIEKAKQKQQRLRQQQEQQLREQKRRRLEEAAAAAATSEEEAELLLNQPLQDESQTTVKDEEGNIVDLTYNHDIDYFDLWSDVLGGDSANKFNLISSAVLEGAGSSSSSALQSFSVGGRGAASSARRSRREMYVKDDEHVFTPSQSRCHTYHHLSTVDIPVKRRFEQATISHELAERLFPQRLHGAAVARVNALLNARDNSYELVMAPTQMLATPIVRGINKTRSRIRQQQQQQHREEGQEAEAIPEEEEEEQEEEEEEEEQESITEYTNEDNNDISMLPDDEITDLNTPPPPSSRDHYQRGAGAGATNDNHQGATTTATATATMIPGLGTAAAAAAATTTTTTTAPATPTTTTRTTTAATGLGILSIPGLGTYLNNTNTSTTTPTTTTTTTFNNRRSASSSSSSASAAAGGSLPPLLFGDLTVDKIIKSLAKRGIFDVSVASSSSSSTTATTAAAAAQGARIHIPSLNAYVTVHPEETLIEITDEGETAAATTAKSLLQEVVMENLTVIQSRSEPLPAAVAASASSTPATI